MIYQSVSGGVGPRLIHKHKAHSQKKGNSTSDSGVMPRRGSNRTHGRSCSRTSVALSPIVFTCKRVHFEGFHKKVWRHVEHKAMLQPRQSASQTKYLLKVVWIFPSLTFWVVGFFFSFQNKNHALAMLSLDFGVRSLSLTQHLLIWTGNPTSCLAKFYCSASAHNSKIFFVA